MSRRRHHASLLIALVAFGVQVAHGVPARATRTAQAVRCCPTACPHHARSASATPRCCVRDAGADEFTASPPARAPEPSRAVHAVPVHLAAPPELVPAAARLHGAALTPRARGVPVRLLTGSLRI